MGDAILYFIIKWVQFIPEYALYMCSQYKLILYGVVVDRIQLICNQKRKLTTIAESKMKKKTRLIGWHIFLLGLVHIFSRIFNLITLYFDQRK